MVNVINEVWMVERNYNVRWITSKSGVMVADKMNKKVAFHIVDLHNAGLQKKESIKSE